MACEWARIQIKRTAEDHGLRVIIWPQQWLSSSPSELIYCHWYHFISFMTDYLYNGQINCFVFFLFFSFMCFKFNPNHLGIWPCTKKRKYNQVQMFSIIRVLNIWSYSRWLKETCRGSACSWTWMNSSVEKHAPLDLEKHLLQKHLSRIFNRKAMKFFCYIPTGIKSSLNKSHWNDLLDLWSWTNQAEVKQQINYQSSWALPLWSEGLYRGKQSYG